MLDEEATRGTHTLPREKRADLTRAPIVVPSSPPAHGPQQPRGVSRVQWNRLTDVHNRPFNKWVAANFEACFRCRCGILHAKRGLATNLGVSTVFHDSTIHGDNSFGPDFGFTLCATFVLPTALLPAEIVSEISETIARGHHDAPRWADEADDDGVLEHVRTLGLRVVLSVTMQRHQCEFAVAPGESDTSIRLRLEREPSTWFASSFTVEVEPVLTYPSWHSWNPKANTPDPQTGRDRYIHGTAFFTYGSTSSFIFEATRRHDKTDSMASCLLNAGFAEPAQGRVRLLLDPPSLDDAGAVHVGVKVRPLSPSV